jgi:murein DD-endopeptidase MepM/ murein hydrolase activator NlpD
MDQQPNVSLTNPNKPSILLVLIALVVAFSLPFVLVKSFPHKELMTTAARSKATPVVDENLAIEQTSQSYQTITLPEPIIHPPLKKVETITIKKTLFNKPITLSPSLPVTAKTLSMNIQDSLTTHDNEWKIIKAHAKDSLLTIFNRAGLSAKILRLIIKDNPHSQGLLKLKANEELQFLIKKQVLEKLIVPFTTTQYLVIYREGDHYKSKINTRKMNSHSHFLTATIQGSLSTTAKRQNIPYKLIKQMTDIFTWDIDFGHDLKSGDQFTIIYKAFYIEDKLVGTGDIIAVSYRNRGKLFQAIRHTNRLGNSEYYTPQGASLKKAFTRYPLRFSHISSTFSLSRYHPILHYHRAHKGVDLAAPIGTPIQATGDGYIDTIGRQSAYGNMIKINHNKTYSTIYGHMLKFQKGLSKGSFVKRGQVIGYVGQTGLASGPHCHYEFHINKQPKNPTTIDLPRGDPIFGRELIYFRTNSLALLNQLKIFEESHLASAAKKETHRRV